MHNGECSDLHRALFDLIAARGVESRGLLEEELSGRLEGLQHKNTQVFIKQRLSFI